MLFAVALILAAYLLGALPFGVWIARRRGVEIQDEGSGNTGATNVARVLGKGPGIAVLILDTAKGALPVHLAITYIGTYDVVALVGLAAVFGHCVSPFLTWRGGKGVATALGVFAVISWPITVIGMCTFLVVWRGTRVVALGSLTGMGMIALFYSQMDIPAYARLATTVLALMLVTHRQNLAKVFFA